MICIYSYLIYIYWGKERKSFSEIEVLELPGTNSFVGVMTMGKSNGSHASIASSTKHQETAEGNGSCSYEHKNLDSDYELQLLIVRPRAELPNMTFSSKLCTKHLFRSLHSDINIDLRTGKKRSGRGKPETPLKLFTFFMAKQDIKTAECFGTYSQTSDFFMHPLSAKLSLRMALPESHWRYQGWPTWNSLPQTIGKWNGKLVDGIPMSYHSKRDTCPMHCFCWLGGC